MYIYLKTTNRKGGGSSFFLPEYRLDILVQKRPHDVLTLQHISFGAHGLYTGRLEILQILPKECFKLLKHRWQTLCQPLKFFYGVSFHIMLFKLLKSKIYTWMLIHIAQWPNDKQINLSEDGLS